MPSKCKRCGSRGTCKLCANGRGSKEDKRVERADATAKKKHELAQQATATGKTPVRLSKSDRNKFLQLHKKHAAGEQLSYRERDFVSNCIKQDPPLRRYTDTYLQHTQEEERKRQSTRLENSLRDAKESLTILDADYVLATVRGVISNFEFDAFKAHVHQQNKDIKQKLEQIEKTRLRNAFIERMCCMFSVPNVAGLIGSLSKFRTVDEIIQSMLRFNLLNIFYDDVMLLMLQVLYLCNTHEDISRDTLVTLYDSKMCNASCTKQKCVSSLHRGCMQGVKLAHAMHTFLQEKGIGFALALVVAYAWFPNHEERGCYGEESDLLYFFLSTRRKLL